MLDCAERFAADLRTVGILPGDTVLVHSSFKSLGRVPGGIETVVQGFLHAIGPDGTLLMPALTWALRPPQAFDVRSTPSIVGAIPEYFRTREGTSRSLHPTHSVCAIGRRTHELLGDHGRDCTPCGMHSPFRKVAETNGKLVMLGCGLNPNTTMHALEEVVGPPYLYGPECLFTIRDGQGNTYQKEYKTHGFSTHGYAQRYGKITELDSGSFGLCQGRVLEAVTFVMDLPGLKSAVLGKLAEDPYYFVEALPNNGIQNS